MSAKVKDIISGIASETAQQLLNAIHSETDPPGSTMLPGLETYIFENRPSSKSALKCGDVIEIQGPAASGKTQLLYHFAACCVLPKDVLLTSANLHAQSMIHVGGWESSVIVCDCDGRWDVRRFHNILQSRLRNAIPMAHMSNDSVSSFAMDSLARLHIFRPTSPLQLTATIQNLPAYHTESMPNEEINLLFVDSISSFYWVDRWQGEPSATRKSQRYNPFVATLQALQKFRVSHGPIIFLTNWGLNPLMSGTSPTAFFRQHIAAPYPAPLEDPPREGSLPLTCHITLQFPFVAQLQSSASESSELGRACQDPRRKEVDYTGEIRGYVRIPHAKQLIQDVAPQNEFGKFSFRVLEHDIVITSQPTSTNLGSKTVCEACVVSSYFNRE